MTQVPNEKEFARLQTLRIGVPEWRVLFALAYRGPQSMYSISNRDRKIYPVVHQATSVLERNRLVRVVEQRLNKKNVIAKTYSLTSEGLLWVFTKVPRTIPAPLIDFNLKDKTARRIRARAEKVSNTEEEILKSQDGVILHLLFDFDVDKIAIANAKLFPLVFEDWSSLKKWGVAQSLSDVFPDAAFSALHEYYHGYKGLLSRFESLQKLFAYESYRAFLEVKCKAYANPSFPLEERFSSDVKENYLNDTLTLYRGNRQIRELLDQILSEMQEASKQTLVFLEKIRARTSEKT